MKESVGKNFFENIRRTIKISYFVASIIPLSLLVFIFVKYIFQYFDYETQTNVEIILLLAVAISIFGLILASRATNVSIKSLQDLYAKLNSLVEVSKQFRETLYLDILLENIVRSAIRINSARSGSLLLYDESGNLKFKVVVGERNQQIKDKVVKRGKGIENWVAESGQPAIVSDVTKDERFDSDFDKESGFKTESVLCVPLINNKEIIGVIEVLNKRTGEFLAEDEKLLFSLADQAAISIAQSRTFETRHSDIIHITSILIEAQDYIREKKGHARRVASYVNIIGKQMGVSEADLKNFYYASLFHDIGFLRLEGVDLDIQEPQNKEKYTRQHPRLGYDMIKPISLWSAAAEIILSHHERHDGKGYPTAKKENDIPLGARILSVANTFDVLTSEYSYKKRIDYNAAIREIEANAGTQFDPAVVKAFKTSIRDADLIHE